jgi:hypothetical protein
MSVMGKGATRRRRKAQDRARQRWTSTIDDVVAAALLSATTREGRRQPPDARFLGILAERRAEAARVLARDLLAAVGLAWGLHWQPVDVVRAVARHRGDLAARVVGSAVVLQLQSYDRADVPPRWLAQIDTIDPGALTLDLGQTDARGTPADPSWVLPDHLQDDRARMHLAAAVEALATLRVLPRLPKIGPLPGEAATDPPLDTSQVDSNMLQRVTSLLAKAESTTFPDEAEALTAKAQELMTRHAIDRAWVEANRQKREGGPEQIARARRVGVDDPYAGPKAILLQLIAEANRCRSVWSKDFGFSTVFGDEVDLDTVELLYTSLLVQSARAMIGANPPGRSSAATTRAFRRSFLVSFATRIGERLQEAVADAVRAADDAKGDLLPVLARREAAAHRACDDAFPTLRKTSTTANNVEGWHAGRSAADRAQLDLSDSIGSGHDRPLATALRGPADNE